MKKKRTVLGAAVLAVLVISLWGIGGTRQKQEEVATVAETTVGYVQEELPVSKTEEILLSKLYDAMTKSRYAETARLLNENEKTLSTLLTETLNSAKYCYWETEYEDGTVIRSMKPLAEQETMEGMVLTRYNTVFFGTFVNGRPEGECHAIQAMVLDGARYTFAEGIWKNGKMNGDGRTGYHYYLNAPLSGLIMTEKSGNYVENLLDGAFVYRTESVSGEKLSWKMEADMGVTVLNEAWSYFPIRKEYMLGAEEDPVRAYVISEEKAGAVMWNNLIVWDE